MKVKDLLSVSEGLAEISTDVLPIKTTLKIFTLSKKMEEALESPLKVRKQLIEKHTESKDEEGTVTLNADTLDEFNEDHDALMEEDVDVEMTKLKISEINNLEMSLRTLTLLENIIDFEEESAQNE